MQLRYEKLQYNPYRLYSALITVDVYESTSGGDAMFWRIPLSAMVEPLNVSWCPSHLSRKVGQVLQAANSLSVRELQLATVLG